MRGPTRGPLRGGVLPLLSGILALLLTGGACEAARKPALLSASSLPDWVQEAAARQVPGDHAGLDVLELHDEWLVEPLAEGGVRLSHRHALRVLRPEGLEAAARIVLPHRADDRVERVAGWNLLPSGSARVPGADDVRDLPFMASGNAVDDTRLRVVAIPGIVVGSVAASETILVQAIDRGAFGPRFGDVEAPTGLCRLRVSVPDGWTVSDHAVRAEAFTRTEAPGTITWSAPHLLPPSREEWAPPDDERLPRTWVRWRSPDGTRGFADWNGVAAWYRALADPVLADCGEAASLSKSMKPAGPEDFDASLRQAFRFASRDVRYVSIQMGIGGYKPQAPAFTCSNRYGDCKAKSFLVRALVEPWGWTAYPVLVLTEGAGRVDPAVPTPGQFNHCIVGLKLPDGPGKEAWPDSWTIREVEGAGRVAFLDPTTESLGPWQLRPDNQGTLALVVLPDGGRLVELPIQPPSESVTELRLRAELDENGQVREGEIVSRAKGTRAGDMRDRLAGLRQEQAQVRATRLLQHHVPGARLIEHRSEGVDLLDGDVVETLRFQGGRLGQRAGAMLVIQPPSLILPVPAALLPPPPRMTRLDLGLPEERRVEIDLVLPEGWEPESLPPAAAHADDRLALEVSWERTPGGYRIRGVGRQFVTSVAPEDYAAFRESAQRANGIEAEGVVVVRAAP